MPSPHDDRPEADKARVGFRPLLSKKSRQLKRVGGSSTASIQSRNSLEKSRKENNSSASPTLMKIKSPMRNINSRANRQSNTVDQPAFSLRNQRLLSNNSRESEKRIVDQLSGVDISSKSGTEKTSKSQVRKPNSKDKIIEKARISKPIPQETDNYVNIEFLKEDKIDHKSSDKSQKKSNKNVQMFDKNSTEEEEKVQMKPRPNPTSNNSILIVDGHHDSFDNSNRSPIDKNNSLTDNKEASVGGQEPIIESKKFVDGSTSPIFRDEIAENTKSHVDGTTSPIVRSTTPENKPTSRPSDVPSSHSRNNVMQVDEQARTIKPGEELEQNQVQESLQDQPFRSLDSHELTMRKDQVERSRNAEDLTGSNIPTSSINQKDEAVQICGDAMDIPTEETKRDIGTQFTFENIAESNHMAMITADANNLAEDKLIFDDEQGNVHYKALSEVDENTKDNNKNPEKNSPDLTIGAKNSFDSRKTSHQKTENMKIEEGKTPKKHRDTYVESSESRDEDRIMQNSSRTNFTNLNTDRRKMYHDIDNLALFTLKDWKDSRIYEWYSTCPSENRSNFVEYAIEKENTNNEVLGVEELSYITKLINSREYFLKRAVKENQNSDGTKTNAFIKFDVFNVLELFESLKRTIVFVYGLFGLDKYIVYRIYGIYHQEDDRRFQTTENATKLCIRCKLGYEMISKWTNLLEQITERTRISQSLGDIIQEVKTKDTQEKKNQQDTILKKIEDLIQQNNIVHEEIERISTSEFKMLLMVATYRTEEIDHEGKLHITHRKKKGFIFDKNDYLKNSSKPYTYPGCNYMQKDLNDLKQEFLATYNGSP